MSAIGPEQTWPRALHMSTSGVEQTFTNTFDRAGVDRVRQAARLRDQAGRMS